MNEIESPAAKSWTAPPTCTRSWPLSAITTRAFPPRADPTSDWRERPGATRTPRPKGTSRRASAAGFPCVRRRSAEPATRLDAESPRSGCCRRAVQRTGYPVRLRSSTSHQRRIALLSLDLRQGSPAHPRCHRKLIERHVRALRLSRRLTATRRPISAARCRLRGNGV